MALRIVTITPSPSGATGTAVIWEFSGVEPYSPLDKTAVLNSQPATTAPLGASVATTSPTEVVIGVANVQGTVTGSENSFTLDSTASGEGWAHLITSTSGTYAPAVESPAPRERSVPAPCRSRLLATAGGACDLNQDGVVNVVDVQLATNIDLSLLACPVDIDGGVCGSTLVNQIVSAALGEGCSATVSHSVSVTWTASSSPNIAGYNVYRSTTSGGTYSLLSALVTTTSYKDTDVVAGETYYYVVTAVNTSNQESANSTQAQATVPITI